MKKGQSGIGRIVASRKLEIEGIPRQLVTVSVGVPRRDSRKLGMSSTSRGHG